MATLDSAPLATAEVAATPVGKEAAAGEVDRLAPITGLPGGTWVGEGRWPDGSPLKTEQRYFWGPTKRVLHFESYDLTGGERRLLYEGLYFFDTKRGRIVQWNFKPNGDQTEIEITRSDATGYEVRGADTWSIIRNVNADEFRWELKVKKGEAWTTILEATYRRQK